jgi:hypothetical protein
MNYARKHKELKYKDFGELRTIKLDPKAWELIESPSALTHTLPF